MAEQRGARRPFKINWLAIFSAFVFLLLLGPSIVIIIISFSSSPYLEFPPPGLSLQWYTTFFGDRYLTGALLLSLRIAVFASAIAVAVGTLTAFILTRYRIRGGNALRILFLAPFIVPYIIQAVGLFQVFLRLGLRGNLISIIIAHAVIGVPYVLLVVSAGLLSVPRSLEEAAKGLGADELTTFRRITLPLIAPSMAAGGVFAFITSFDEFIIAFFLAGVATETFPIRMFLSLRDQVDPRLTSISTILIVVNFAALLLFQALSRRRA